MMYHKFKTVQIIQQAFQRRKDEIRRRKVMMMCVGRIEYKRAKHVERKKPRIDDRLRMEVRQSMNFGALIGVDNAREKAKEIFVDHLRTSAKNHATKTAF